MKQSLCTSASQMDEFSVAYLSQTAIALLTFSNLALITAERTQYTLRLARWFLGQVELSTRVAVSGLQEFPSLVEVILNAVRANANDFGDISGGTMT